MGDECPLLLDLVGRIARGLGLHACQLLAGLVQFGPANALESQPATVPLNYNALVGIVGMVPHDDAVDRHPALADDRLNQAIDVVGGIPQFLEDPLADDLVEEGSGVRVAGSLLKGEARVVRVGVQLLDRHCDWGF